MLCDKDFFFSWKHIFKTWIRFKIRWRSIYNIKNKEKHVVFVYKRQIITYFLELHRNHNISVDVYLSRPMYHSNNVLRMRNHRQVPLNWNLGAKYDDIWAQNMAIFASFIKWDCTIFSSWTFRYLSQLVIIIV